MTQRNKQTKRGRGRPELPDDQKRIKRYIRASDEEWALYEQAAQAIGQQRTTWMREALNRAARRAVRK